MAEAAEDGDTWETKQLENLKLSDPLISTASASASAAAVESSSFAGELEDVDPAIIQALQDSKERPTGGCTCFFHSPGSSSAHPQTCSMLTIICVLIVVIKIEELVEAFLSDTSKDVLEFPASFTNYQRMLAHRLSQWFGLQTSTVDYEATNGRVVANRTKWSRLRQVGSQRT